MITETERARLSELDEQFMLLVMEDSQARARIDAIFAKGELTAIDEAELLALDKLRDSIHVRKNAAALESAQITNPRFYRRR